MSLETTACPGCARPLTIESGAAYCEKCDLHLAGAPTRGRRVLGYILSLPERLSRSLVGSAAGVVKGTLEVLLPDAMRQTKLYEVLLRRNLRYLIQDVGAVEDVFPPGQKLPSKYVARKFVGNFVELAGILTLRASPVWILALVSDLSGGTKVFLKELVDELKREGLLDAETRVENVDQLLDGLQSFTGRIADKIDMPPLSIEELRETVAFLRQESRALELNRLVSPQEREALFEKIKEVARKEDRSLFEVSAALAMNAVNQLERSGRAAVTGLKVGRSLLDRTILQHYSHALKDLSSAGYYRYLGRASKSYLRAVKRHLAWRNLTWTEKYFLSRAGPRVAPLQSAGRRLPPRM